MKVEIQLKGRRSLKGTISELEIVPLLMIQYSNSPDSPLLPYNDASPYE